MNVIAIFDVGKTNKKLFLIDEQYRIVWEHAGICESTTDEDGDPCEDVSALTRWIFDSLDLVCGLPDFAICAINFAAYGASLVYVDDFGTPLAPLYNYLKPYPKELQERLYNAYDGATGFCLATSSPALGSLNSGLQLYRIKEQQPALFEKTNKALHLPQYLSSLLTNRCYSDMTSIGCHTHLWDFSLRMYHRWLWEGSVIGKLARIRESTETLPVRKPCPIPLAGIGVHDSSAALIPYLGTRTETFALISTGTWCITLSPFNQAPLTADELKNDCLCYLDHMGRPVKASRLFAGFEHEQRVLRLAHQYHKSPGYAATIDFDPDCITCLQSDPPATFEEAYHLLMRDIMDKQVASTNLVLKDARVRHIFVDGGFANNKVYMHLLARAFPDREVFAASVPQATALGAALVIHEHWNTQPRPQDMIGLMRYSPFTP
jgi:L-fuculokinase